MIETKNAVIESTSLGREHGCMTFMLILDYGGCGQGAGGYVLDGWNAKEQKRTGWVHGITLLSEIMDVVGVERWEDLKGKHIRVKAEHNKVHAIGNFLKDDWLNFEEWCEAHLEPK